MYLNKNDMKSILVNGGSIIIKRDNRPHEYAYVDGQIVLGGVWSCEIWPKNLEEFVDWASTLNKNRITNINEKAISGIYTRPLDTVRLEPPISIWPNIPF